MTSCLTRLDCNNFDLFDRQCGINTHHVNYLYKFLYLLGVFYLYNTYYRELLAFLFFFFHYSNFVCSVYLKMWRYAACSLYSLQHALSVSYAFVYWSREVSIV